MLQFYLSQECLWLTEWRRFINVWLQIASYIGSSLFYLRWILQYWICWIFLQWRIQTFGWGHIMWRIHKFGHEWGKFNVIPVSHVYFGGPKSIAKLDGSSIAGFTYPTLDQPLYACFCASADFPVEALTNSTVRKTWIDQQVNYLVQNKLDGVNIDFEEEINCSDKARIDGFTTLMRELSSSMRAVSPHVQVIAIVIKYLYSTTLIANIMLLTVRYIRFIVPQVQVMLMLRYLLHFAFLCDPVHVKILL